jgi:hypothetical protein
MKERSSQVQRMSDIYSLADRVIVWLGPEENNSTVAMKLLASLDANIEVDWEYRTMRPSSLSNEFHWGDQSKMLPYNQREFAALAALLNRSWYERLWILQEMLLANARAVIMCGFTTMLWNGFRNCVYCLMFKLA